MVQMFRDEVFDANRKSEKARRVFEDLWQGQELRPTIDRVGFNPPENVALIYSLKFIPVKLAFGALAEGVVLYNLAIVYIGIVAASNGFFAYQQGKSLAIFFEHPEEES